MQRCHRFAHLSKVRVYKLLWVTFQVPKYQKATKNLQQYVFENNFKNIFLDLYLCTFFFAQALKEHTTTSLDDFENIQCKSQLQQVFWFTFVISTIIKKKSNSHGKLLTNHKLVNTNIFKFIRKMRSFPKRFPRILFLLIEISFRFEAEEV